MSEEPSPKTPSIMECLLPRWAKSLLVPLTTRILVMLDRWILLKLLIRSSRVLETLLTSLHLLLIPSS